MTLHVSVYLAKGLDQIIQFLDHLQKFFSVEEDFQQLSLAESEEEGVTRSKSEGQGQRANQRIYKRQKSDTLMDLQVKSKNRS